VLDLGCGTGRGGFALALLGGLDVTLVDFADNCLDEDIRDMLPTQSHALRFVEADLTKPLPVQAAYGFCVDVLEHIPPSQVDAVIDNCLTACQHVYFQIATEDDVMGELVGHKLHLSVHPYDWWEEKFRARGVVVHWSKAVEGACAFYVTGWSDPQVLVDAGEINVEEQFFIDNVKHNVAQGWQQVTPHLTNDSEVMILGGGPSLNQSEDEIRALKDSGVKVVTLNGAYNWCLERGITPVTQVMVDAREFNARFTKPVREDCMYLLASQCHPTVFEGLPKERTYLWHTSAAQIVPIVKEKYGAFWSVPGGSTVLLRAIPLLRMLGFKRQHLFGCDSCLTDERHHAYTQIENDQEVVVPIVVGGRLFRCHPWMAAQAQEFINLIKQLGDEIELEVHGDGLLAYILEAGARMADEQDLANAA